MGIGTAPRCPGYRRSRRGDCAVIARQRGMMFVSSSMFPAEEGVSSMLSRHSVATTWHIASKGSHEIRFMGRRGFASCPSNGSTSNGFQTRLEVVRRAGFVASRPSAKDGVGLRRLARELTRV